MTETKEILKTVKKVEIKTRTLVEGLLQGAYHSVFKGRGIEFSEVREYVPGDDIRTIDWNVTARMNTPYVKEFIEERDLTVYLVFDASASSNFGSAKEKRLQAIEIAATLGFAAMKNNDNIGLFLFTNGVEKFVPARKGKKHVLKLIREMIAYQPKEKATDITASLATVAKAVKKRSIIFILSDFLGRMTGTSLKMLKNRHDVIAVDIFDERELDMPDIGYIELEDEETGEQILVNTSDKVFREKFTKLVKNRRKSLIRKLNSQGIDIVSVGSGEAFEVPLRRFFNMRERRMR